MESTPLRGEAPPLLPGRRFRVHDARRPQPRRVRPGSASTQARPGTPPSDAVVLFGGTDLARWESVHGGPAPWRVAQGVVEVLPGTGAIRTQSALGDCQLHVEWAVPAAVTGTGQDRGNSGVMLMGLYEIQVLDGDENPTYPDGMAAAIYGQYPPLVNACQAPGAWQCYEILWTAPRFADDQVLRPAFVTVVHNGCVVHHHTMLFGPTQHGRVATYRPHPPTGPLWLQDHGACVRYRNIWYRPLMDYDAA